MPPWLNDPVQESREELEKTIKIRKIFIAYHRIPKDSYISWTFQWRLRYEQCTFTLQQQSFAASSRDIETNARNLNTLYTTLTVNTDSYVSHLVSYFKRPLECLI